MSAVEIRMSEKKHGGQIVVSVLEKYKEIEKYSKMTATWKLVLLGVDIVGYGT